MVPINPKASVVRMSSIETNLPLRHAAQRTGELKGDELDQVIGGTPSIPIPPPAHAIGGIEVGHIGETEKNIC
jgi:hypothetical protein